MGRLLLLAVFFVVAPSLPGLEAEELIRTRFANLVHSEAFQTGGSTRGEPLNSASRDAHETYVDLLKMLAARDDLVLQGLVLRYELKKRMTSRAGPEPVWRGGERSEASKQRMEAAQRHGEAMEDIQLEMIEGFLVERGAALATP